MMPIIIFLLTALILLAGCNKSAYIDQPPQGTPPHIDQPPQGTLPQRVWTAQSIQIHSAPDAEHPIIRRLPRGTALKVHSSEGGWYFVAVNDRPGGSGWIDARYVTSDLSDRSIPSPPMAPVLEKKHLEPSPATRRPTPRQVWAKQDTAVYLYSRRNSEVNGKVLSGVALEVRSAKGNWYFVAGENDRPMGWIEARYVTTHPEERQPLDSPTASAQEQKPPETPQATILPTTPLPSGIPLRWGASTSSPTYKLLSVGTAIEIRDSKGDWYFVTGIDQSFSGWVHGRDVTLSSAKSGAIAHIGPPRLETDTVSSPPASVVSRQVWTEKTIPLRSGPHASLKTLELIPPKIALEVIYAGRDWYFVQGASLKSKGWVEARYVRDETVGSEPQQVQITPSSEIVEPRPPTATEPQSTPLHRVWTAQSIQIHSAPDAEHPIIRRLPRGTALKVHSSEGGWYFVAVDDRLGGSGWIDARYVTPELSALPILSPSSAVKDWLREGNDFYESKNYEKAIFFYNKAIEISPSYDELLIEIYINRGKSYMLLGDYDRAVKDYDEVIKMNPQHVSVYTHRGEAKILLGRHQEGIKDLQTSARLGDEHAQEYLRSEGVAWQ